MERLTEIFERELENYHLTNWNLLKLEIDDFEVIATYESQESEEKSITFTEKDLIRLGVI